MLAVLFWQGSDVKFMTEDDDNNDVTTQNALIDETIERIQGALQNSKALQAPFIEFSLTIALEESVKFKRALIKAEN